MTRSKRHRWDALDAHGYKFRETCRSLIRRYGTTPSKWADGLDHCEIGVSEPLLDGLAHPFAFQVSEGDVLDVPPASLFGHVRQFDDEQKNYALAVNALTQLFGEGRDRSVSNTQSMEWDFEDACVDATIFPRDIEFNQSTNTRHSVIPGSATECTITILPAYCRELSDEAARAFSTYHQYDKNAPPRNHQRSHSHSEFTRHAPGAQDSGFGLDDGGKYLIQMLGGRRANILPLSQIASVTHHIIKPAKGGGRIYVSMDYRSLDPDVHRTFGLSVLDDEYRPRGHPNFARELAKKLGVPLEEYVDVDA